MKARPGNVAQSFVWRRNGKKSSATKIFTRGKKLSQKVGRER